MSDKDRIAQLEAELAKVKGEKSELEKGAAKLETKVAEAVKQNAAMANRVDELEQLAQETQIKAAAAKDLEARLDDFRDELKAELHAHIEHVVRVAAPAAGGAAPAGVQAGPDRSIIVDKRKKLKATTKTFTDDQGKKFAQYVVGPQGCYRSGRTYEDGEVITLPFEEEPSHTFKPLIEGEDKRKAELAAAATAVGDTKRASDNPVV